MYSISREQLAVACHKFTYLHECLIAAENQLRIEQQKIIDLTKRLKHEQAQKANSEIAHKKSQDELKILHKHLTKTNDSLISKEQEVNDLEQLCKEHDRVIIELTHQREMAALSNKKLVEQQLELEKSKLKIFALQQTIEDLQKNLKETEKSSKTSANEASKISGDNQELILQNLVLNSQHSEQQRQISDLTERCDTLQQTIADLSSQYEILQQSLQFELDQKKTQTQALYTKKDQDQALIDELRSQNIFQQIIIDEKDNQISNLENSLKEALMREEALMKQTREQETREALLVRRVTELETSLNSQRTTEKTGIIAVMHTHGDNCNLIFRTHTNPRQSESSTTKQAKKKNSRS